MICFLFFLKGENEMMKLGWRGFSYIDIDLSVTENSEWRIDKPQRKRVLNPWDLLGCASELWLSPRETVTLVQGEPVFPPRSALPVEHFLSHRKPEHHVAEPGSEADRRDEAVPTPWHMHCHQRGPWTLFSKRNEVRVIRDGSGAPDL